MDSFGWFVALLLFIGGFIYLLHIRPKYEKERDALIFDNRVLATIDGLYLSGIKFYCADFEMRAYAKRLLDSGAHLSHTICDPYNPKRDGFTFHCYASDKGAHLTTALLCVITYAKEDGNQELIERCERMLFEARQMAFHY